MTHRPSTIRCLAQVVANCCLAAAGAAAARGQEASTVTTEFRTVQVAAGVHALIAPAAYGGVVNGNVTVIIGDSAVVVVDAGYFPALTRRMISEIRRLSPRPVRYLVTTHWHPDHWVGNAEFRKAYPGLSVIASSSTREELLRQGPGYVARTRDSSLFARIDALLASGKNASGAAFDPQERAYYVATLADGRAAMPAWRDARLDLPDLTVDSELTLHLGGRDVVVRHPGRGNTRGDLVVFVPDTRTLVAGDVLVAPTPYAYGAFMSDWHATLGTLSALAPAAIVPGHGAVMRDTLYLALVRDLVGVLARGADSAVASGATLEQWRAALDLGPWRKRFTNGDPRLEYLFNLGFTQPGSARAFAESRVRLEK